MASSTSVERPAHLKAEDGMLVTRDEADYMVEKLRIFDIEQVGRADWLAQHEDIEKLNLQAHYNTMSHSSDFVMEVWMEKIFSEIIKEISSESSTVALSLTILHEGSIANLLEVVLYHQDACEAMGSDALLELADFCCRKLLYLNTRAKEDAKFIERKASDLINMSVEEEFKEKGAFARFQTSMCALTILRYLTDYINSLPLCIMARLIVKHDVLMILVPLIGNCPWKRERRKGEKVLIEKYEEGRWFEVPREDHFKVTKPDAQVWLAIYNLIMEPACRSRFKYDDFHKDQVLKLQKHLNELLVDQIPLLKDLQWALEEISLNVKPKDEDRKLGSLILEQTRASSCPAPVSVGVSHHYYSGKPLQTAPIEYQGCPMQGTGSVHASVLLRIASRRRQLAT
ncbi:hypothetical protein GOP47_0010180 [Adiantum capillus-veneris]|uniref:Uncharacterized protein n=1 Tax=Adiantum capillus-veneris TaxID=13818 RepID=A0A9D4UUS7_ADICA|nr:hypothetical protein GOP47_0010180 [Adiantum capillus-veneris]